MQKGFGIWSRGKNFRLKNREGGLNKLPPPSPASLRVGVPFSGSLRQLDRIFASSIVLGCSLMNWLILSSR